QIVSTEQGLAATIDFPSRWPVGGEIFLLTAPFIERRATYGEESAARGATLHRGIDIDSRTSKAIDSRRRGDTSNRVCSANRGRMLLPIHVAAGGLALVLGAVALLVKKGGDIHRRSGLLFVFVMLVMATIAAILGNVLGGLIPVYFVSTALTTVRPVS